MYKALSAVIGGKIIKYKIKDGFLSLEAINLDKLKAVKKKNIK